MNQLPKTHKLPILNEEEIGKLSRSICIKEIELVIKMLPRKKPPDPSGFIGDFYQTLKELTAFLHDLFQKIHQNRTLPNSVYKASITLILNQTIEKIEKYNPSHEHKTQKSSTKYYLAN